MVLQAVNGSIIQQRPEYLLRMNLLRPSVLEIHLLPDLQVIKRHLHFSYTVNPVSQY